MTVLFALIMSKFAPQATSASVHVNRASGAITPSTGPQSKSQSDTDGTVVGIEVRPGKHPVILLHIKPKRRFPAFQVRTSAFSGGGARKGMSLEDKAFDKRFICTTDNEAFLTRILTQDTRQFLMNTSGKWLVVLLNLEGDGQRVDLLIQRPAKDALVQNAVTFMHALNERIERG